jgi:hypothetical protein
VFIVFCVCKVVESVDLWEAVLSEVAPSLWRSEIMTRVSSSVIAVGVGGPRLLPIIPRRGKNLNYPAGRAIKKKR